MDEQLKSIKKHIEDGSTTLPTINFKGILLKHIYNCVSKTIFIKNIASKFIKLIFQLIIRFTQ